MYKKFGFFAVILGLGLMISNVGAISNWTQMLTSTGDWGLWSPNKANTNVLPNMIITKDGKMGIGLTDNNTLTNSYYKPGDIIAKRFCFENNSECHSSFANNLTNNTTFNIIIPSNLAFEDANGTIPYGNDRLKPFYIRANQNFINTVGLDSNYGEGEFVGDQATNWFNIGQIQAATAYENIPKSLWGELGANPVVRVDSKIGPHTPTTGHKFYNCHYLNTNGVLINSINESFCSNPSNNIIRHSTCNLNKKYCGILHLELRFTIGNTNHSIGAQSSECYSDNNTYNYMGQGPLSFTNWSNVELLRIANTSFKSPIDSATYNPEWCRNYPSYMGIGVQGRLVLKAHGNAPAQSLTNYLQGYTPIIKINKIGLTYLR